MNRSKWGVVPVLVTLLAAGCASAKPAAVARPAHPVAKVAPALVPAASKALIRFDGLVNGGHPVAVDLASLDALPQRELTIYEPFVKKTQTFTGVSFDDLLSAARATGKTVTIHALDDYSMDITATILREPGVMLATRAGGKLIALKSGGPTRVVYPDSSKAGKNKDLWVWSIDHISVR